MQKQLQQSTKSTRDKIHGRLCHCEQKITVIIIVAGRRRGRCNQCPGCQRPDCGTCKFCLDKPKFGGKGLKKQCCANRKCTGGVSQSQVSTEKMSARAFATVNFSTVFLLEYESNKLTFSRVGSCRINDSNAVGVVSNLG